MESKASGFLLTVIFLFVSFCMNAQVTTANMTGKVTGESNEPLAGALVIAIHEPSGTRYSAMTDEDGRYSIQGMRAGSAYKIMISYTGMKPDEVSGIILQLGETFRHDVNLLQSSAALGEIVVVGKTSVDGTKTGASMSINQGDINRMPSITHGIADAIRMNPQVRVANDGAIYFLGTNNRYNSFRIDGVMNNDVYGLTANGSNGGQAGTQPVSMETIEQIQINIAPFDIRQSGFTGGSINAVTKSGTNDFHGVVYGYGNNKILVGNNYRMMDGNISDRYADINEYMVGVTLGGPVIKNKLFFFVNYEKANKTYKNPYSIGNAPSRINVDDANKILKRLQEMADAQGIAYNGDLDATDVYTKSDKAGVKLDWNVNDNHKISLRWGLVSAKQLNSVSSADYMTSSDFSFDFISKTNSFVAELQSRLSNNSGNELRASYVRVRDRRRPGDPFPMIQISNVGDGVLNLGNDRSSMANRLDQDIWSLTDNFSWYTGNHTFVFGTHNEFYNFSNLFIQDAYGTYYFNNPDDFYAGYIKQYRFAQANVDVTGDPRWAAAMGAGMLGFYAGDNISISSAMYLTLGFRMDIPLFFDTPAENVRFNEFMASKGWKYRTNSKLNSTPLFSPRVGFRWNIDNGNKYILRGGAGIFTGRIPFVWLSNTFSNTGIQFASYNVGVSLANPDATKDLSVILDPDKQYRNVEKLTAGSTQIINVFDEGFKLPQNLRANIAMDFELGGINWTVEGIYSKTLNDILYRNIAVGLTGKTLGEVIPALSYDSRPMLDKIAGAEAYSGIYVMSNTNKGYTYSLSLTGEKKFSFGLDIMASYTYMESKTLSTGIRSVASTDWQDNNIIGNPNAPELRNSSFNIPHSIHASVFYTKGWKANQATTVGIVYTGCSGVAYSVRYDGDLNGDTGHNDLIYIPTDEQVDQMDFATSSHYTVEQQKANLKEWLANDAYMKKHRGEYYERNSGNEMFEHHFDLHLSHKINFRIGKTVQGVEILFDVINIGNMFSSNWGRTVTPGGYYKPISYKGDGKMQFLHDAGYDMHTYDDYYSRWRGQVGLKYSF